MMFPKQTGLAHTLQTSAKTDTFLNHWASWTPAVLFLKGTVQDLKAVALVIAKSSQRFQTPGTTTEILEALSQCTAVSCHHWALQKNQFLRAWEKYRHQIYLSPKTVCWTDL